MAGYDEKRPRPIVDLTMGGLPGDTAEPEMRIDRAPLVEETLNNGSRSNESPIDEESNTDPAALRGTLPREAPPLDSRFGLVTVIGSTIGLLLVFWVWRQFRKRMY
jgi:hypothetical protein